ncbi:quinone oxidoreductase [Sphingomonas sp. DBB INV C78]|uniref:quinone oxidoreductase family protein n=1 Tax=Sphingomonas sp. DBB INV C78 TaxID=3349434 RepID=UPI0036D3E4DA
MSDAWRMIIRQAGGPEVIEREDIALPSPSAGQARVRHEAIGVNFIDTYHRGGLYPLSLPSGLGSEAAGIVEAVGEGVDAALIGQRVAYVAQGPRTYATHGLEAAGRLYPLPDAISAEDAAAMLLKGLTAWMLVERVARVQPGQSVLVHAAAGGVGSILVPWLKAIDAKVIAHTGSAAKADRAKAAGADHALSAPFDTLASEVRELTGGRGVDAVLDGVGADSWAASLASVAKRGILVTYGNASGPVPAVSPLDLLHAGSIFLTRPTMFDYLEEEADRRTAAERLFGLIAKGAIKANIGQRFALSEAADAHRALESRAITGSTVLLP